jgi:hypothetical protein
MHFNSCPAVILGYPWIDAAMRQLSEWGWMHHLARHSVACFLTRGDLYISWEEGKAVFEELLLDAVRDDFWSNIVLHCVKSGTVVGRLLLERVKILVQCCVGWCEGTSQGYLAQAWW